MMFPAHQKKRGRRWSRAAAEMVVLLVETLKGYFIFFPLRVTRWN
jgi:hypothetical protein